MKRTLIALAFFALTVPAYAATPAPDAGQTTQASVSITGWRLECNPEKTTVTCHVIDQIVSNGTGTQVIGFNVFPAGDGKANLTISVPLGAQLRAPVRVAIAGGPTQDFAYLTCSQQGCFATAMIAADLLAAMRAGKGDMRVTYGMLDNALGEHKVAATLSLAGFGAVYDRLK